MIAVRRFAAGDAGAVSAIIRGLPDYFTDDVPAKVDHDAASHQAWVLTDSGTVAGTEPGCSATSWTTWPSPESASWRPTRDKRALR
jgi:hypothetical protein